MDTIKRSSQDRRSGKDRRRLISLQTWFYKDDNRRQHSRRGNQPERRDGWVKLDRWSSVRLADLKIAKFLD